MQLHNPQDDNALPIAKANGVGLRYMNVRALAASRVAEMMKMGAESNDTPPIVALNLTGLEVQWMNGEVRVVEGKPDLAKTYNTNNSIVAFVDARGNYFVSPRDNEKVQALQAAGYKLNDFTVELSNGEHIVIH